MSAAAEIQIREGDVLAGKYALERVLGQGGMGCVLAIRHRAILSSRHPLLVSTVVRDESTAPGRCDETTNQSATNEGVPAELSPSFIGLEGAFQ